MNPTVAADRPAPLGSDRLVDIEGTVQGIGFRPFVVRLAADFGVRGWVRNGPRGATLRVAGDPPAIDAFLAGLRASLPPAGRITTLRQRASDTGSGLAPVPAEGFSILGSTVEESPVAAVTPDLALCAECRAELLEPRDRRHGYPFINCTNCGPRYTILDRLPYDRPHTTMARFEMCPECSREYSDPANRRFHAQPNACPVCGPQVELQNAAGDPIASHTAAIEAAAAALRRGQVVAVKGLGGFHLLVDATNTDAVMELRRRKHRDEKPFAVMFGSLEAVRAAAFTTSEDERLLASAAAPIVLVRRRSGDCSPPRERQDSLRSPDRAKTCHSERSVESTHPSALDDVDSSLRSERQNTASWEFSPSLSRAGLRGDVANAVAPGNPWIGALLPYTPLHELLLRAVGRPVVATSGNLAEEPLCTENVEARERLGAIADLFLVHDRPIARPVDDSVIRPAAGGPVLLRRARGFAPAPFRLPGDAVADRRPLLCVGGHLKNTIAVTAGDNLVLSPHIGDLDTAAARATFTRTIELFRSLHGITFEAVACDAHPDYASTRFAESLGIPVVRVQHHLAHVLACLLEHEDAPDRVLGVAWDGTGYGPDGTIWGGEFIVVDRRERSARRFAHLRPFRLPGAEIAIREPRRSACGLLGAMGEWDFGQAAALGFSERESTLLRSMVERGVNAPVTTSAGRLFDGVAALLGLRSRSSFEGQAAMNVESAAARANAPACAWPMPVQPNTDRTRFELDWRPALAALLAGRDRTPVEELAARFHTTLAAGIVAVAERAGVTAVVLSGGCFQNVRLLELATAALQDKGFGVLRHRDLPPNDGGLAAGQALGALWEITTVA